MSAASVSIRRGKARDAETLSRFAARMYAETFGDSTRPEDLAAFLENSYGTDRQAEELASPDYVTFVAEGEASLAGFAQVRRHPPPDCVTGPEPVELWRFYVERKWQGSGLAQRLMKRVHAAARELGGRTLWLSVWEKNFRAIAFYVKCGFIDAGSHPFWVGSDKQTDRILVVEVDLDRPADPRDF